MRPTALVLITLGFLITTTAHNILAQAVSASSSANSAINFGNSKSDSNENAIIAAVIGGMFALAGTIFTVMMKQRRRSDSRSPRRRGHNKSRRPEEGQSEVEADNV